MPATAGTHPAAVTLATSNSRDDSNIMTTETAGTQATAGIKATPGPPTQYERQQLQGCYMQGGQKQQGHHYIRDNSISSREASNIQQGRQQQQQELL
jgi:hypothetical protein